MAPKSRFLACVAPLFAALLWNAAARPSPAQDADRATVSVPVLFPTRMNLQRCTTQPATVHAFYEASIYAKTTGYLAELKAEIGDRVQAGDLLGVIAVPELVKQREAKQADILRLQAEERRSAALLAVAEASVKASSARVEGSKAELGKAEAATTAAQVELDRMTSLVERQAVADRLLDEATKKYEAVRAEQQAFLTAVTTAQADLTLAQAERDAAAVGIEVVRATTEVARRELEELTELLAYAELKAPFDGMITQRHVNPGDLIRNAQTAANHEGQPLFAVTRIDKVRIRVPVPERDAPLVDVDDEARVTLQALGSRTFTGRVARTAGVLDQRTRTLLVEIDVPNPDGKLLPGMFGQATITLEPAAEKIVLPAGVVRYDESGKSYVYAVNASNQIEIVEVITGWDTGQQIEVTEGLSGNERIVGKILGRLRAGQTVAVEPSSR